MFGPMSSAAWRMQIPLQPAHVVTVMELARFENVVGNLTLKETLESMGESLELFKARGVMGRHHPRGLVIYGPDGTGKQLMIRALAGSSGSKLVSIDARKLPASNDSDLKTTFGFLRLEADRDKRPTVIHITNIDAVKKQGFGREQGMSAQAAILWLLQSIKKTDGLAVVFTVRDRNDFPCEYQQLCCGLEVEPLNAMQRYEMFERCIAKLPTAVRAASLAEQSEGFNGESIEKVCRRAKHMADSRWYKHEDDRVYLGEADFLEAIEEEKESRELNSVADRLKCIG